MIVTWQSFFFGIYNNYNKQHDIFFVYICIMWSVVCVCGVIISHYLHELSFVISGSRGYYWQCLLCCLVATLYYEVIMSGLICWWNNRGIRCDNDAIVCLGYMVLVWWHFWCILWEVCCGGCVVLLCMVLSLGCCYLHDV